MRLGAGAVIVFLRESSVLASLLCDLQRHILVLNVSVEASNGTSLSLGRSKVGCAESMWRMIRG